MTDVLRDRQQRIIVNGSESGWKNITSGIPQGSVLGPILFLIYINHLPGAMSCLIKLFADDAKLYSTVENDEKELALQNQVTRSENWAAIWKMFFNILKCHHLHIGINLDTEFKYEMTTSEGKAVIEQVKSECDLGVTVDSRLKFRDHINKKVSIANRNLGIIFRTFTFIDKEMFLNLFKSMVRPRLEYGSPIWSPLYKKDKVIIENVQRRGTRMVKSLKDLYLKKPG